MATFSPEGIEAWKIKQILSFLNRAKTVEDIVGPGSPIVDDPNHGGSGSTIGETVAQHLLDRRQSLRPIFFKDLEQLNDISGLGEDKFQDLLYSFRKPAAELFKEQMYDTLLGENWNLQYYRTSFRDTDHFRQTVENPHNFLVSVKQLLTEAVGKAGDDPRLAKIASSSLAHLFVDAYDQTELAQYAWALWFYRFDQDNWFSFDRVRKVIQEYLNVYFWGEDRIELRLIKGFENGLVLAKGISPDDLPITINYAEQSLELWTCELFD